MMLAKWIRLDLLTAQASQCTLGGGATPCRQSGSNPDQTLRRSPTRSMTVSVRRPETVELSRRSSFRSSSTRTRILSGLYILEPKSSSPEIQRSDQCVNMKYKKLFSSILDYKIKPSNHPICTTLSIYNAKLIDFWENKE